MDYSKFTRQDVIEYINANLNGDLHSLLLKKSPFTDITMSEIGQQVKGRQIAERKFPGFVKSGVVYPPTLNLEQTSSEATANYKAQLIEGESWLDLTSGFGIDSFFMSQKFSERVLVEQNAELVPIVQHNFGVWQQPVKVVNSKLEDFMKTTSREFDVVYLDPARRNASQRKVFLLEDLSPNILEIQDRLLTIGRHVVIKLSPLIDLSYLIEVLPHTYRLEVIALKNDVKEVVVFMSNHVQCDTPLIRCINLESGEDSFEFTIQEEREAMVNYSEVKNYVYLPNNALIKAGAYRSLASKFGLSKLHPNTHIYTLDRIITNFPGRVLQAEEMTSKDSVKGQYYNIVVKNYPNKPEDLKKKYKTKDGGQNYLIFLQDQSGKKILKAHPLS